MIKHNNVCFAAHVVESYISTTNILYMEKREEQWKYEQCKTQRLTLLNSVAQWRIQDGAFGANAPPPPPPPPFKKLHTRSRYSNRAVNYSNKAVTMFMRQCSLPMKL